MADPCPFTELLPDLPDQECVFDLRQVSGLIFGLQGNPFTVSGTAPATDIDSLTAYTTRIAAAEPTKIQVLQRVASFVVPVNESIGIAADTNDTAEGYEYIVDETTQMATFRVLDATPALIEELKKYDARSKIATRIGVLFLTSDRVISKGLDFIPINNMFTSGLGLGGKTEPNVCNLKFNMNTNWWESLQINEIDTFNPLDLLNA